MRSIAVLGLAAALASPSPAVAQDGSSPPPGSLATLDETLSDPAQQRQIARTLRVLGEILLDMPLAPLAEAASRIAGEDAPDMAPGTTLRSMAPQAAQLPEQLERHAPRALEAMGTMAEALEAMVPTMQDMAKRLQEPPPVPR